VIALLVAPLTVGVLLLAGVGRGRGRAQLAVAAAPLVAALAVLGARLPGVVDGDVPTAHVGWVRAIDLGMGVRLDGFAAVVAVLVAGIGALVLWFAAGYLVLDDSAATSRFAGELAMFAGVMLGLVLAADVWTLFVFWELTSVLSFLLIGLEDRSPVARAAAQRALLVTAAGGLVMLGGLICLVDAAGSADLATIVARAPTSGVAQVGLVLVLIGACSKSAQVPLHFWLPGAMAAPTPVSAYLHSATMVKAGVLVVAQLAPAFAGLGWWRPALVTVGGLTMLTGGVAALRRDDAKQSLAFGTVSQLGLLTMVFGLGGGETTAAAVVLLVAHALFKSGLFLTIGAVDHLAGSRDLRSLSGVGRQAPLLAAAAAVLTCSMIGVGPVLGFVAKEAVLTALVDGDGWVTVTLVVVVVGSVLTAAYSTRLWLGLFGTKRARARTEIDHAPGRALVGPVVVLAAASLAGGVGVAALRRLFAAAVPGPHGDAHAHLAVIPSLGVPLALSVAIVVVGGVAGWWADRRDTVPDRDAMAMTGATFGERTFARVYSGLLAGAGRLTERTQSGSLPVYLTVVFGTIVLAVAVPLLAAGASFGHPVVADSALQLVVAVATMVLAVAAARAGRRFVAVLLLGGVGQGLTVLFLMYGAPDLALTQFMIETLSIVAFLLVLRHLPRDFPAPPRSAPLALRLGLALAAGTAFAVIALVAGSGERPTDATDAVEALSLSAAGGRNVVNVTIVDFRGIDTLGEITVFGIAALGVANLITAARRRPADATTADSRSRGGLARIGAESMVFEQVTRAIFHLTLLVSVFVMLRGHNAPGGGFAGGLIAGAAFVFRILAGSPGGRPVIGRVSPVVFTAVGMLLAVGTGVAPLLAGNEVLESSVFHVDVPFVGDVKLVSAGVFDLGVYVLVIGVVINVLSHLAARTHRSGSLIGDVL